jgi:putative addiction module component (TIGR02574 family)
MTKSLAEIESEARQLSTKERARLVRRLISTLESEDDGDVEQAWLDEAERRLAAYRSGDTTAQPAEEVLEAILSRY